MAIKGKVWKYGDDINTDVIFPGKYTYTVSDPAEMGEHALEDLDPEFRFQVQPGDVIVAGKNFGCGSSREQAVTCLVAKGVGAVIARSFARIAETNLKRQGLLPLTFADPADYEKIQVRDRISIRGLADLAPGSTLTVVMKHEDGTEDEATVNHTLSEAQVEWFKAGSALNAMRMKQQG